MFIFLFSYRPLVAPGCDWPTPVPKVIDRRVDVLGTRANKAKKKEMLLFPKIGYILFLLRRKMSTSRSWKCIIRRCVGQQIKTKVMKYRIQTQNHLGNSTNVLTHNKQQLKKKKNDHEKN